MPKLEKPDFINVSPLSSSSSSSSSAATSEEKVPEIIEVLDRFDIQSVPVEVLRLMINDLIREGYVELTKIPQTTKKDDSGYRNLFATESNRIDSAEIIDSFNKAKTTAAKNVVKKTLRPVYPVRKLDKPVRTVKPTAKVLANQEGEQQKAFHMKVKQAGVTSGR